MKTNPIIYALFIALLGISIYLNFKQYASNQDAQKRLEVLQSTSNKQSVIITRYIAPDSTKHVVYKEVYAKSNAEKELAVSRGYVDSLRKALNVKAGQITELTRVKATVSGTVKTKAATDSAGNNLYAYSNKWLNVSLNPSDSILKYRYRVELTDTKYFKGNWLTGRTWYRDIHLADTNATITGIERFSEPPFRPKRFGLGLQVGYYYDPSKRQLLPAVGVGLSYNLIQY